MQEDKNTRMCRAGLFIIVNEITRIAYQKVNGKKGNLGMSIKWNNIQQLKGIN